MILLNNISCKLHRPCHLENKLFPRIIATAAYYIVLFQNIERLQPTLRAWLSYHTNVEYRRCKSIIQCDPSFGKNVIHIKETECHLRNIGDSEYTGPSIASPWYGHIVLWRISSKLLRDEKNCVIGKEAPHGNLMDYDTSSPHPHPTPPPHTTTHRPSRRDGQPKNHSPQEGG